MINPEVNYDCFNDSSRRQFGGVTLLFAQMMYYRATMKAEHFLKLIRSRHKVSFGLTAKSLAVLGLYDLVTVVWELQSDATMLNLI